MEGTQNTHLQSLEEVVKTTQDPGRYEYLPISGLAPFVSAARQVLFGPLGSKEARVVSLQAISATGARLAATILSDPHLFQEWLLDLREMSGGLDKCAEHSTTSFNVIALGTPGRWDHVISQIGMFSYTGLTPEQVASIQENSHVYILESGRISVAGLNTNNVKHVTEAIDAAVRTHPFRVPNGKIRRPETFIKLS